MIYNEKEVLEVFRKYLTAYFSERDLEKTITLLSDKLTLFGTGEDEFSNSAAQNKKLYKRDIEQAPNKIEVEENELVVDFLNESSAFVLGNVNLKTVVEGQTLILENLRMTMLFEKQNENWQLRHKHVSFPFVDQKTEESYPLKELQIRNKSLEEMVNIKTEELQAANSELSKLNENKNKLFLTIAHDLRSPFHSLLGLSDLIINDSEEMTKEEIKEYVGNFSSVLKSQLNLLENLFNWSRLQIDKVEIKRESMNLYKVANEVISVLSASAKLKGISVSNNVETETNIFADNNMMHSILRNLISNAIKFTKPGGKVSISSRITEDSHQIAVTDTGIGINQEDAENLFRIGSQLTSNGTQGEKGSGLGLTIIKEMVEKHDGTIWIESKIGEGSKLIFSIPQ